MTNQTAFDNVYASVRTLFNSLMATQPVPVESMLMMADGKLQNLSGVYVFSEVTATGESYLYVGQSNDLLGRLKEHCSSQMKANFAYMMTVEETGQRPIPFSPNASKHSMFSIPEFKQGFSHSQKRILKMNYRWVNVDDKLEKNLLEIFAAVVLDSKFNDFN